MTGGWDRIGLGSGSDGGEQGWTGGNRIEWGWERSLTGGWDRIGLGLGSDGAGNMV